MVGSCSGDNSDFGPGGDGIGASGGQVAAEPAGAAALNILEDHFGFVLQTETAAGRQVVEYNMLLGIVTRVISVQSIFDGTHQVAVERYTPSKTRQQRMHRFGEKTAIRIYQTTILLLPFMSVCLGIGVFQVRLQMCRLMQKYPKEEVWVEVAVDTNLMVIMIKLGPTVVAQFAAASTGDMEMHTVTVEVVIHSVYRLRGEMIPQDGMVSLFGGQRKVSRSGDSRSRCACVYTCGRRCHRRRKAAELPIKEVLFYGVVSSYFGVFYCERHGNGADGHHHEEG